MSILKKLVNPNLRDYDWSYWYYYYMENYSGRLSDPFCSEMFLCKKLIEIAPFQDWVFSQNSMENIIIGCLAYETPFGSPVLITPSCESKEKIISKLQDFIRSDKHSWESLLKYGITYNSLVSKMDVFNDISDCLVFRHGNHDACFSTSVLATVCCQTHIDIAKPQ